MPSVSFGYDVMPTVIHIYIYIDFFLSIHIFIFIKTFFFNVLGRLELTIPAK